MAIAKIVNYYAVVFLLRPPNSLRRGPLLAGKNVCNSQEIGVCRSCAAIVNLPAVLKILRVVHLLRVVFLVRRGTPKKLTLQDGAVLEGGVRSQAPCPEAGLVPIDAWRGLSARAPPRAVKTCAEGARPLKTLLS